MYLIFSYQINRTHYQPNLWTNGTHNIPKRWTYYQPNLRTYLEPKCCTHNQPNLRTDLEPKCTYSVPVFNSKCCTYSDW